MRLSSSTIVVCSENLSCVHRTPPCEFAVFTARLHAARAALLLRTPLPGQVEGSQEIVALPCIYEHLQHLPRKAATSTNITTINSDSERLSIPADSTT